MHHDVDLTAQRRRQRCGIVRDEIMAAPAPLHPLVRGQIEPEVAVGEEEDA
jgi:hypothetical protein